MSSYLASACTRPPQCARAAEWLGALLGNRGDWAGAAAKYERAAREDPTAARWLKLAESAARAGQATRARHALRRAKRSREEPDAKQVERVEKVLQQAVFDDLRRKP
jgi:TolA-binding protein